MATKLLKNVAKDSIVKIKENGVLAEFCVAKHNYETELNGIGRTLLVRKEGHSIVKWDAGNVNEYDGSDVDLWLNNDYRSSLDEVAQRKIGETEIRYAKGKQVNTAATMKRGVFLLSVTEFGLTYSYATAVGTALPTADNLKIAYADGTAVNQWTRSPYTSNATYACILNTSGSVAANDAKIELYYARPAFTLPDDSTFVTDDGEVVFDAPVISGEDSDLGEKTKDFSVEYSVTTVSGTPVTVTETVFGKTLRTYEANSGETQSVAVELGDIVDGGYEIVITVENQDGDVATRKYTFTAVPISVQSGGTVQELQDETANPVYPATLARAVFTDTGKSVQRVLNEPLAVGRALGLLVIEKVLDSCIWVAPKAVEQKFVVVAIGGGGGGGGGDVSTNSAGSVSKYYPGGGGAGGYVASGEFFIETGTEIEIVCGAGGTVGNSDTSGASANTTTDGVSGGDTIFGDLLTAAGGEGGGGANAGSKVVGRGAGSSFYLPIDGGNAFLFSLFSVGRVVNGRGGKPGYVGRGGATGTEGQGSSYTKAANGGEGLFSSGGTGNYSYGGGGGGIRDAGSGGNGGNGGCYIVYFKED